ncbi:rCG41773, partial [Rattus norvegicus]
MFTAVFTENTQCEGSKRVREEGTTGRQSEDVSHPPVLG